MLFVIPLRAADPYGKRVPDSHSLISDSISISYDKMLASVGTNNPWRACSQTKIMDQRAIRNAMITAHHNAERLVPENVAGDVTDV